MDIPTVFWRSDILLNRTQHLLQPLLGMSNAGVGAFENMCLSFDLHYTKKLRIFNILNFFV